MKGIDGAREEEWKGRERREGIGEMGSGRGTDGRERWRRNLINLSFFIIFVFKSLLTGKWPITPELIPGFHSMK